jgi:hypothetical protein
MTSGTENPGQILLRYSANFIFHLSILTKFKRSQWDPKKNLMQKTQSKKSCTTVPLRSEDFGCPLSFSPSPFPHSLFLTLSLTLSLSPSLSPYSPLFLPSFSLSSLA